MDEIREERNQGLLKRLVPDKVKVRIKNMIPNRLPPIDPLEPLDYCICCGSRSLIHSPKLWDELISQWELSDFEADYINRQQGLRCKRCKSNLRTMSIAYGMMRKQKFNGLFRDFVRIKRVRDLRILEINEAGQVTQYLCHLQGHVLSQYPDVDIQKLPYGDYIFDVVIHSDTLEHVEDPILALKECCRVLKPDGYCIFTIPIVIDRVSKSRADLPFSHHGSKEQKGDDYLVFMEFGADAWKYAIQAGFSEVRIYSLEYPAAQSLLCAK